MEYVINREEIDARAALIVDILTEKKWTISFAESCTAGLAAAHLVDIPSASNVFNSSFVTYSNEAKEKYLGRHHRDRGSYRRDRDQAGGNGLFRIHDRWKDHVRNKTVRGDRERCRSDCQCRICLFFSGNYAAQAYRYEI